MSQQPLHGIGGGEEELAMESKKRSYKKQKKQRSESRGTVSYIVFNALFLTLYYSQINTVSGISQLPVSDIRQIYFRLGLITLPNYDCSRRYGRRIWSLRLSYGCTRQNKEVLMIFFLSYWMRATERGSMSVIGFFSLPYLRLKDVHRPMGFQPFIRLRIHYANHNSNPQLSYNHKPLGAQLRARQILLFLSFWELISFWFFLASR